MSYWEFLIQRENDRAWRPLTSRNLQIFEGNYRIIANTSITNSAVRTKVFHQTSEQPPRLSQNHSQSTSNEGMLVVLPFTHLQTGTWHVNCNVTNPNSSDTHEQLCLKVIPRPVAVSTATPPSSASTEAAVMNNIHPHEIIASSISDLDLLLSDIEPSTEQLIATPHAVITEIQAIPAKRPVPATDVLDLSFIPADEVSDPFAAALQIALQQREQQQSEKLTIVDDQLQEFLAITNLEFSILDPDDLPMNSYDLNSYEVVVD
jgi:hypothetical protein